MVLMIVNIRKLTNAFEKTETQGRLMTKTGSVQSIGFDQLAYTTVTSPQSTIKIGAIFIGDQKETGRV